MESLVSDASANVDENDPRSVTRFMRRLGREMGEDLGDDFEQAVDEAEMAAATETAGGSGSEPSAAVEESLGN